MFGPKLSDLTEHWERMDNLDGMKLQIIELQEQLAVAQNKARESEQDYREVMQSMYGLRRELATVTAERDELLVRAEAAEFWLKRAEIELAKYKATGQGDE